MEDAEVLVAVTQGSSPHWGRTLGVVGPWARMRVPGDETVLESGARGLLR